MTGFSGRSLGSANTYEELWYAYFADQTAIDYSYELEPFYAFSEPVNLNQLILNIGAININQLVRNIGRIHYDTSDVDGSLYDHDYTKSYITDLEILDDVHLIFSIIITMEARGVWDGDEVRNFLNPLRYETTPDHSDVLSGVGYNRSILGHYMISWGDRLDVSIVHDTDCTGVLFYTVGPKRRINISVNQMLLYHHLMSNGFLRFIGINRDQNVLFTFEYEPHTVYASAIAGLLNKLNIRAHIIIHFSNLESYSNNPIVYVNNNLHPNLYYPNSRCIILQSGFLRNNLLYCIPARFPIYFVHRAWYSRTEDIVVGGWPSLPYFVPIQEVSPMPSNIENTYYKMQVIHLFNMVHSFNHVPSMNMNIYRSRDIEGYLYAFSYDGIDYLTSPVEYYEVYMPESEQIKITVLNYDSIITNLPTDYLSIVISGDITEKKIVDYAKLVKPIFIMNKDASIHANYRYNILYRNNLNSAFTRYLRYDNILLDQKGISVSEIIMNTTTSQIRTSFVNNTSNNIIYGGITHINFYTGYPFLVFNIFEDRMYQTPFGENLRSIFESINNSHYPIFNKSIVNRQKQDEK